MNEQNANKKNAVISAILDDKGFVNLYATIDGIGFVPIRVNDYGGASKKRARGLTYKIYKTLKGE